MLLLSTVSISREQKCSFDRLTDKTALPLFSLSVTFKMIILLSNKLLCIHCFKFKTLLKTLLEDSLTQSHSTYISQGLSSVMV